MADPVGVKEIAERLKVHQRTAVMWHYRKVAGFPAPRWTVSGNPAWDWRDIERWAKRTGRLGPTPGEEWLAQGRARQEARLAEREGEGTGEMLEWDEGDQS